MSGLLLIGAFTAVLLAVLGSLVQAVMSARQRTTQFAIFRTLGMANNQLTRLLLGEQTVVYLFGLIGGTVLGLILTTATWPYLTFSDSTIDPDKDWRASVRADRELASHRAILWRADRGIHSGASHRGALFGNHWPGQSIAPG